MGRPEANEFDAFAATLPNPRRAARLHCLKPETAQSRSIRWRSQQERRALILAAARTIMSDVGLGRTHLQSIADQCQISVPTIYSIVGNRSKVLQDASAEWVEWMVLWAGAQPDSCMKLLMTLYGFWLAAIENPTYTINAVEATKAQVPISASFRTTGARAMAEMLSEIADAQWLRMTTNLKSQAWHLRQTIHSGVCEWATNPYDPKSFLREFQYGPGAMLTGMLVPAQADRIAMQTERIIEQTLAWWEERAAGRSHS